MNNNKEKTQKQIESDQISDIIGKKHTRHNYGDKFYNESRQETLSKTEQIEEYERKKRILRFQKMNS